MKYKIIVKPKAEKELQKALNWYDDQKDGLGIELYIEIADIIDRIKENPNYFQKRYRNFRISFTKKFRYGIHYIVEEEIIYIHAILHTSQKPKK